MDGGGVDSAEALGRIGTSPIVQKLTILEAYEHLPVEFVDNWEDSPPITILSRHIYVVFT